MANRRETPIRRRNPSGAIRWVARYTDKAGKRRVAGTYAKKGPCKAKGTDCCAQHAIEDAYERDARGPMRRDTIGSYAAGWIKHRPRSRVTDDTNAGRLRNILDAPVEGVPLRDWQFDQLRRRHVNELVTYMFVTQERALLGVRAILQTLSALTEDAIEDEVAVANPFKGVRVKTGDPRIVKAGRKIHVWEWHEMRALAAAAGVVAEGRVDGQAGREHRATIGMPMIRVLSDCGLRIGELLALRRQDLHLDRGVLEVRQTMTRFGIERGTKSDKLRNRVAQDHDLGREVPLTAELCEILGRMPKRIDTPLLFPAPAGNVYWPGQWRKDILIPAQKRCGLAIRPHEMRHSFASHMLAAGVDEHDLAEALGHTVLTMLGTYSHPLRRSFDVIREAVGE